MTTYDALIALKKFLEEDVAPTIELQREKTDQVEYVNPYVGIISLPHKNFMPVNFTVPYILVGFSEGNEDDTENALTIRIQCATYGGDVLFEQENNIPDEKGYLDLINLIERIKNKLIDKAVVEKAGAINKPILYGVYDEEITYPYWYGYLQFTLQIPINNRQIKEFL